jgi:hypothetical protein
VVPSGSRSHTRQLPSSSSSSSSAAAVIQQSGDQTSAFESWSSARSNDPCSILASAGAPAAATHAAPLRVKLMVPMSEQELAEWRVLQKCKQSLISGAGMVETGADGVPDRPDAAGAPLQRTLTPVVNTLALAFREHWGGGPATAATTEEHGDELLHAGRLAAANSTPRTGVVDVAGVAKVVVPTPVPARARMQFVDLGTAPPSSSSDSDSDSSGDDSSSSDEEEGQDDTVDDSGRSGATVDGNGEALLSSSSSTSPRAQPADTAAAGTAHPGAGTLAQQQQRRQQQRRRHSMPSVRTIDLGVAGHTPKEERGVSLARTPTKRVRNMSRYRRRSARAQVRAYTSSGRVQYPTRQYPTCVQASDLPGLAAVFAARAGSSS